MRKSASLELIKASIIAMWFVPRFLVDKYIRRRNPLRSGFGGAAEIVALIYGCVLWVIVIFALLGAVLARASETSDFVQNVTSASTAREVVISRMRLIHSRHATPTCDSIINHALRDLIDIDWKYDRYLQSGVAATEVEKSYAEMYANILYRLEAPGCN